MPPDPLDAVLRLRKVAVDDARRELVANLHSETAAEAIARAAEALIIQEGEFAADLAADDGAVEAYGRWLPSGRAQAAAAHALHEAALGRVAVTRAALSAAQAAAEAASKLLERRAAERAAAAERRAQQAMDEVAARQRKT